MPRIISTAALCIKDDDKRKIYEKKLNTFLDEYETRTEFSDLCKTSASSVSNVYRRIYYFDNMTREELNRTQI